MAQSPSGLAPIKVPNLKELLTKAKADPAFANKLRTDATNTLKAEHLRPDPHWVRFFSNIKPGDFEHRLDSQIDVLDGEGVV
jgi:hypothetical protein